MVLVFLALSGVFLAIRDSSIVVGNIQGEESHREEGDPIFSALLQHKHQCISDSRHPAKICQMVHRPPGGHKRGNQSQREPHGCRLEVV